MEEDGEEDMGDAFLSDDSSFYGDEDLRRDLEDRAAAFDVSQYWSTHHHHQPSVIAATAIANNSSTNSAPAPEKKKQLYNRYEGNPAARQLSETVPSFLSRLPPLTTRADHAGSQWIYIANPHSASRPTDQDRAGFQQQGQKILRDFETAKQTIESSSAGGGRSKSKAKTATTNGTLTSLRKNTEAAIYAAAKEKNLTSGKWMLFPRPRDVDRIWSAVALATANGDLGHAAKVATDDGDGDNEQKSRLICVYTEDFSDRGDVARVLGRMGEMGLVNGKGEGRGRGVVYYKADAFTELGIEGGNEWGFRASLFSEGDFGG